MRTVLQHSLLRLHLSLTFILLAGCEGGGFTELLPDETTASPTTFSSQKISSSTTATDAVGRTYSYDLYRLQLPGKTTTFAQWIPITTTTARRPAVLIFLPYEGINWTGLGVDTLWHDRGNGLHPDSNGPSFNAGTSSSIAYYRFAPEIIGGESFVYSYNDIHVLAVYGRFYAGGDLQNDIDDVLAGLEFLNNHPSVDPTKIGIYSGSWGGMISLYAIAQAEAAKRPTAAALLYPLSDANKIASYVNTYIPAQTANGSTLAAYNAFFEPYFRRIDKATESLAGQSHRYDQYSHSALTTANPATDFFFAHDAWDTLIPLSMTSDLITALGNKATDKVYYHLHGSSINHDTFALDHFQSTEQMKRDAILPLAHTFLLNRLLPTGTKWSIYSSTELSNLFTHTRDRKILGANTTFFTGILNELCRSDLGMVDTTSAISTTDGRGVVNLLMYNYIGVPANVSTWDIDTNTICARVAGQSPF